MYAFPVDPALPRLRWWVDPRKLKRSLEGLGRSRGGVSSKTEVEILRYKPQRRLVARVELRTRDGHAAPLLVRYGTRRSAHRLQSVARRLRDAGVNCPAPVIAAEQDRVTVDLFMPGRTLGAALATADSDPDALADALCRFHRTPFQPVDGSSARLPSSELGRAASGLLALCALRPELDGLAEHLRRALVASSPPDPAP